MFFYSYISAQFAIWEFSLFLFHHSLMKNLFKIALLVLLYFRSKDWAILLLINFIEENQEVYVIVSLSLLNSYVLNNYKICKIHISAHPLMIERGRHLNIPRTDRYCLLCKSNQIEDEKYFLLHCKKFNTQRNIFNEKILNILENASYKNANNKISFLINNKSYSILRLTSSFISNCLNIRKDFL